MIVTKISGTGRRSDELEALLYRLARITNLALRAFRGNGKLGKKNMQG